MFGTKKTLFGSGKDLDFFFNRKIRKPVKVIGTQNAFLVGALSFIAFIYSSLILPNFIDNIVLRLVFAQILSFLILPIFSVWYLKGDFKESLGVKIPKIKGVAFGFFLWTGTFLIILVYSAIISKYISTPPTLMELEKQMKNMPLITKFLMIALTPAICEEVLFRGVLFRSFEKKLSPRAAVILTAMFFSIIHMDVIRLFPTFLLGLVFGITAYKSKSIFPSMILHLINNSIFVFVGEKMGMGFIFYGVLLIISVSSGVYVAQKS